jgi:hypothetical protein
LREPVSLLQHASDNVAVVRAVSALLKCNLACL